MTKLPNKFATPTLMTVLKIIAGVTTLCIMKITTVMNVGIAFHDCRGSVPTSGRNI